MTPAPPAAYDDLTSSHEKDPTLIPTHEEKDRDNKIKIKHKVFFIKNVSLIALRYLLRTSSIIRYGGVWGPLPTGEGVTIPASRREAPPDASEKIGSGGGGQLQRAAEKRSDAVLPQPFIYASIHPTSVMAPMKNGRYVSVSTSIYTNGRSSITVFVSS